MAASTRMEGVPVTVEEVRHILAGARPTDVEEGDAALVEGYRDAIRFAQARSDAAGFQWNAELIVGLHDRAMAGRADAGAGRFATGARWVASEGGAVFEPPAATDIVSLVAEMCEVLNAGGLHPPSRQHGYALQRRPSIPFATATAAPPKSWRHWPCTTVVSACGRLQLWKAGGDDTRATITMPFLSRPQL